MNSTRLSAICVLACCLISQSSCRQASQFSEFKELEIEGRPAGIYLPAGYTPKKSFPVIYMEDGLVFKDCNFKSALDSLIELEIMKPVIVACSYENKMKIPGTQLTYRNAEYIEAMSKADPELMKLFEEHYRYFNEGFVPYIEEHFAVSTSRGSRLYFGTSNSADFGITLSFRNPELFSEYWCFSPVYSDVSGYGMLTDETSYRICWGKFEELGQFNYFPELLKDIRKRGGTVQDWIFNGGHDRSKWRYWFVENLKLRFPSK